MRLDSRTAEVIKVSVLKYDPHALVYLFGSRTDDDKRGGDIDIMVISSILGLKEKISIEIDIERELVEQDLDMVIRGSTDADTFTNYIFKTGVVIL